MLCRSACVLQGRKQQGVSITRKVFICGYTCKLQLSSRRFVIKEHMESIRCVSTGNDNQCKAEPSKPSKVWQIEYFLNNNSIVSNSSSVLRSCPLFWHAPISASLQGDNSYSIGWVNDHVSIAGTHKRFVPDTSK